MRTSSNASISSILARVNEMSSSSSVSRMHAPNLMPVLDSVAILFFKDSMSEEGSDSEITPDDLAESFVLSINETIKPKNMSCMCTLDGIVRVSVNAGGSPHFRLLAALLLHPEDFERARPLFEALPVSKKAGSKPIQDIAVLNGLYKDYVGLCPPTSLSFIAYENPGGVPKKWVVFSNQSQQFTLVQKWILDQIEARLQ